MTLGTTYHSFMYCCMCFTARICNETLPRVWYILLSRAQLLTRRAP